MAKEGIATINPNTIDRDIDTIDIKIVVVNPLNKNFRFVKPLTLLGDNINQSNSCFPHDNRNNWCRLTIQPEMSNFDFMEEIL